MNTTKAVTLTLAAAAAAVGITSAVLAPNAQAQPAAANAIDNTSYALGADLARTLVESTSADGVELDRVSVFRGFTDVLNGQAMAMTEGEIRRALADLEQAVATRAAERRLREDPIFRLTADANAARGKAFRDDFAARPGVQTLNSGVLYEPLDRGEGDAANTATAARFVYTAATAEGDRFAEGLLVEMEFAGMLPAVADTIRRMRPGDRWIVVIPPEAAFGIAGHTAPNGAVIGPNQTLIATVELLEAIR